MLKSSMKDRQRILFDPQFAERPVPDRALPGDVVRKRLLHSSVRRSASFVTSILFLASLSLFASPALAS
jgi:hypothetical protein